MGLPHIHLSCRPLRRGLSPHLSRLHGHSFTRPLLEPRPFSSHPSTKLHIAILLGVLRRSLPSRLFLRLRHLKPIPPIKYIPEWVGQTSIGTFRASSEVLRLVHSKHVDYVVEHIAVALDKIMDAVTKVKHLWIEGGPKIAMGAVDELHVVFSAFLVIG